MATVNTYFWVGQLSEGELAKALKAADPSVDPVVGLSLPPRFERRLGHDFAALTQMARSHTQWRRLLTLVMLASALERYLAAVSRIAVESDPALEPGFPKVVDGAKLTKKGLALPPRDLTGLVVGEWSQRIALFSRLFGTSPRELLSAEGELESIRKTRNRVAHALGVDDGFGLATPDAGAAVLGMMMEARRPDMMPAARVSDDRLTALMKSAQGVVDAVDEQLLREHIGSYEIIATYLSWNASPSDFESRAGIVLEGHRRGHDQRFSNVVGELVGSGLGSTYIKGLEAYVRAL